MYYADLQHRYGNSGGVGTPVKWAPTATLEQGRCKSTTTSVTMYKTTLSETYDIYPEKVSPYPDSSQFKVVWEGSSTGRVVGAVAESFVKIPNNRNSGFEFWVRRKYSAL